MPFNVYLRDSIGNQVSAFGLPKVFTTPTLDISDGLLTKGAYKIPLSHILIIEEV